MSYSAPLSYILKWNLRKLARYFLPVFKRDTSSSRFEGNTGFNRILDNSAREEYRETIELLYRLVPEIMERKISEANVQQAFVLDTVQKFAGSMSSPRILSIGCFEDSAAECLERLGFRIKGIDPILNYDLGAFFDRKSTRKNYYNIIFSTSVIEHVQDDELFIKQIIDLLAPGGIAILTCDYNDQYKPGDVIPQEDLHMYTQNDFRYRFLPLFTDCSLIDEPQWECQDPDFSYAGYRYTFASFVFRKNIA